ncbi:hypothetical protein [Bacillus sp. FSL K6-3431]|uniref:hypothetical protein n=1 Tax=Bacillus sp. FSL K6-3431 TaxID=2921500 RepID=UPI0030FA744E
MKRRIVKKWDEKLSSMRKYSKTILKYGTAIALFLQVTSGTLFAPEFQLHNTIAIVIFWGVIGCLLIPHHYATKARAFILLGLFVYITMQNGIFHMLDYGFHVEIIGVLLVSHTKWENEFSLFIFRYWSILMLGGCGKMGIPLECHLILSQVIMYQDSGSQRYLS